MLRASSQHQGLSLDLRAISDPTRDSGVPFGSELLAAADAAVLRDDHEIGQARDELVRAMGPAAAVRAFAVAGNFEMMNRLLDGQGVLPGVAGRSIGDEIGYPFVDHHGNEDLVSSR